MLFRSPPVRPTLPTMAAKSKRRTGPIDWDLVRTDFTMSPDMTMHDCAAKYDIHYVTIAKRAGPTKENWIAIRRERLLSSAAENESRLAEILCHDRADNERGLRELEKRLEKVCLSALELLFPPTDSPVEVQQAARNRLESMSGNQLGALVSQGMRTLTETGRHRRLLSGEATAIFARADSPDVYLPEPIEVAQALEMRSRMAQAALRATADGTAIDIEGFVLSPVSPVSPEPLGVSPIPPMSLNARKAEGRPDCVTSQGGAGGNGNGADVGL